MFAISSSPTALCNSVLDLLFIMLRRLFAGYALRSFGCRWVKFGSPRIHSDLVGSAILFAGVRSRDVIRFAVHPRQG